VRRGVVQASSATADHFATEDLLFLDTVANWIGLVGDRAELAEQAMLTAFSVGLGSAAQELLSILTPRQQEVAKLIAAGLAKDEIGSRLFITSGSVANHIERIFQRLNISRRTQLASWIAMTNGTDPFGHEPPGI
jgi:DNA-binding NarL/FixJ family response regulator